MRMKYKGQALALVLVLLLVGSVVGFALYARSLREAERLIAEKASAEANELVETVIGIIGMSDFAYIKGDSVLEAMDCEESDLLTEEGCRKKDIPLRPELEELLGYMVETEVDFSSFDRVNDFCRAEIMMRYGMQDDEVIISKDDMYGLFFSGITNWDPPGGCEVDFQMNPHVSPEGFVMSTFYRNSAGDYKEYFYNPATQTHDDILGFRYGAGGSNWVGYTPGSNLSFPVPYRGYHGDYRLYEVRFTAIGGSSSLTWQMRNCDIDTYLVVEVGSTCHNRYVGKRFNVPSEPFAPPIFDYVLFNGAGQLRPERIGR